MEFQDVVRKRRMIRAFADSPIPADVVARILANARRGPSSGFSQGFEFLVFDGAEQTTRFWEYMSSHEEDDPDVMAAPLIIVPVAHPETYVQRYLEPDKSHVGRAT